MNRYYNRKQATVVHRVKEDPPVLMDNQEVLVLRGYPDFEDQLDLQGLEVKLVREGQQAPLGSVFQEHRVNEVLLGRLVNLARQDYLVPMAYQVRQVHLEQEVREGLLDCLERKENVEDRE